MKNLRVLVVIPSYYPAIVYGGPIHSTHNVYKRIKDIEIRIATTDANGSERLNVGKNFWSNNLGYNVKYYKETIVGRFSVGMMFGLWDDVARCDVLHIQSIFSISTLVAIFYGFLQRKPMFLSPRGSLGEWCVKKRSGMKKAWLFILMLFARKVVWHATSEQEKQEIIRISKNASVHIIPNGIALDELPTDYGSDFFMKFLGGERENKVVVASLCRIEEKKGLDILIRAFALSLNNFDGYLFIAGPDYGYLKRLQMLVKEEGLETRVYFLGEVSGAEKYKFLHHADVFALPSHNENFGNVYLEALSVGTPILASIYTPWKDVNELGCGKWVDNSVQSVREALISLSSIDKKMAAEIAIAYSKSFDWEKIAREFSSLYKSLLENVKV